jgi:hypothetical protein
MRKRLGSARASHAGDDASSSRSFPEGVCFGEGAETNTRGVCAPR